MQIFTQYILILALIKIHVVNLVYLHVFILYILYNSYNIDELLVVSYMFIYLWICHSLWIVNHKNSYDVF